ncbi:MAG TPA: M20/M25/M40 family metallo-hydrolase, partial [Wenzhouxiangella sp.]|nr:M20/M25/M40 family metallo-hydrolase [Wenzhouxiangella sp.]
MLDSDIDALPADRAIWVMGWNNRWKEAIETGLATYDAEIGDSSVRFGAASHDGSENSFIVALRHPGNTDLALSWLTVHDADAVADLARKLPHYGKYSYLGFSGADATNSEKGQWPAVDSPLATDLAGYADPLPELEKRPALATLSPIFDAARMEKDVQVLADESMQGRGIGTEGLDAAAEYIADQLREAGLEPAGEDGSYFQPFEVTDENGEKVTVRNVLAVLPGSNEDWKEQSVVVSAHYDHLGLGWPDVRAGNKGKIHYGADDNASGVAVMLELARTLGKSLKPSRSIVFASFTAEEAGLLGARHYVETMQRYPASQVIGNLNLDTVGRLGDNEVLVLGSSSAREWKFIFMGATAVTGVPTKMPTQAIDSSDHVAFVEAGVPAVQFFSGFSPDYHQPTDTADKVDINGMMKVAAIVREGIEYLAERPEPMQFTGSTRKPASASAPTGQRRVSTGLMPDFAFSGKGVAVAGVSDGTPAKQAGLREGDVIIAINGKP